MKIRDLITQDKATLSFEVFPPKKDTDFADVEAAALGIAAFKPDYMSVTYGAGGSTKGHTIQLAQEIQEKYDVPTIAHLTCVCASKEGIKTALADMKNAGIENILALRGDIPKNYDGQVFAEFSHASELVELIKETGDFCVGGACYPEVHPDSANKHEDIIGLKKKVDAGCDYLTTQMFFDNSKYFDFVERCRKAGITVPIIPGIKPISTPKHLEILPRTFSVSLPEELVKAVRTCGEDTQAAREVGIEWAIHQAKELKAAGVPIIHFYTMGRTDNIRKIARNVF